jgi:alginate O-acetyltransferase complex protein AlgJ
MAATLHDEAKELQDSARTGLGDWSAILGFALLLLAPLGDQFLRPVDERSVLVEFRKPHPTPTLDWSLDSLRAFPGDFERWYADCFGLRDRFIRAHNALAIWILRDSPASIMVLGKDRWIFYRGDLSMETHRGAAPLKAEELERWRAKLEWRRDFLATRGIDFLYVIVPNKSEVYPELLPAAYDVIGPSRRAQFFEYMATNSDVAVVDLLPTMLKEKAFDHERDHVYFPLGSHWGSRGAWAGYRTIVQRLRPRFPEMQPWSRNEFIAVPGNNELGDSWAWRLYLADVLKQEFEVFAPVRGYSSEKSVHPPGWSSKDARNSLFVHKDESLPVALVFHDSYGPTILPYLAQHFSQLIAYRRLGFPRKLVERHKVDIVIQIYSERTFGATRPGKGG